MGRRFAKEGPWHRGLERLARHSDLPQQED
jgi:hypothetical protein